MCEKNLAQKWILQLHLFIILIKEKKIIKQMIAEFHVISAYVKL